MIAQDRLSLNRSVCPHLGIVEFFELASRLEISKLELRNDLPSGLLDAYSPQHIKDLAAKYGIKIITINALHNLNHAEVFPQFLRELTDLLKVAVAIDCEAVILVPSRLQSDPRSRVQAFQDTVDVLRALRPYFEENGLLGYLETLGFPDCSMQSPVDAMNAIRESGAQCYKIVYDTFHHFIGPDTAARVEKEYDVSAVGLVHASAITSDAPPDRYTDDLRVMLGPGDKIDNLGQIALLEKLGYRGNISFEPFSPEVQEWDTPKLEEAIRRSIKFLQTSTF